MILGPFITSLGPNAFETTTIDDMATLEPSMSRAHGGQFEKEAYQMIEI